MAHVRYGSAEDAEAISRVRRDAWRTAYVGIITDEIIERATGVPDTGRERALFVSRPWRRTLVAEHTPVTEIIGYASFGPERDVDGAPLPERTGRDGRRRPRCAELYALYVTPARWSTGAGRDLMLRVLEETRAGGYPRIILWVLQENARARQFYERSGFRPDGRSYQPDWLGGVTELCYARDLEGP